MKTPGVQYRVVDNRAHSCIEIFKWMNPVYRVSYEPGNVPGFRQACQRTRGRLDEIMKTEKRGGILKVRIKVEPAKGAGWTLDI